ncbi:hypothetical protein KP509_37G036100 [Ceratopteris richardii]|uniref:Uncharacterized protein n=1 Tax=Ceratopteris richardii TaxID=49495 RepID=A0A8T2Q883_CERRI|nr:hypothetical protein KP509_37G036100 [Ceratopteris richardii]
MRKVNQLIVKHQMLRRNPLPPPKKKEKKKEALKQVKILMVVRTIMMVVIMKQRRISVQQQSASSAQPETPVIEDGDGSKTVFVKNLAWSVDEEVVCDFLDQIKGAIDEA